MPLPTDPDLAWPPEHVVPVLDQIAEWSAWYRGDTSALSALYSATARPAVSVRPSQYRGGVAGALARAFWGRPSPTSEVPGKFHVPIAADLAELSSDMLFSELPALRVEDEAGQKQIEQYAPALHIAYREAAEVCAAKSGVYLRVVWDSNVSPEPWTTVIHPETVIPEFQWGRLSGATLWREIERQGATVVRHLEYHESGFIHHAVYEGNDRKIGRLASLAEYAETAALAERLDNGDAIETGIDALTVQFIPNVRPNRVFEDLAGGGTYLGRSDYQGVESTLDALDEAWSSWLRDIRLAKSRIVVPQSMLQTRGQGQPGTFDVDREIFVGLDMLEKPGESPISHIQPEIRFEAHERTCQALTETAVRSAGWSIATFTGADDGSAGAATATEINSRDRKTHV